MTRDYSVVNALVSEIGDDYVTYRAFDNQNGPNIRISTKNVFKITFQNGSEQFFDASGKMVETKAEAQSSLAAVSDSRAYAPSRSALLERSGNNLIFQNNGSTWALTPEMVSPEFGIIIARLPSCKMPENGYGQLGPALFSDTLSGGSLQELRHRWNHL